MQLELNCRAQVKGLINMFGDLALSDGKVVFMCGVTH